MRLCCNDWLVELGEGKYWCCHCDHEEIDPNYKPETTGCCATPNINSTPNTDTCQSCGYHYDYRTNCETKI